MNVLVSGCSSGIGETIARQLVAAEVVNWRKIVQDSKIVLE